MSFVLRLISRNWRLKLAALGMALFLWAIVRAEPGRTSLRTLSGVPVIVEVADLNWTTAGPPLPETVDIRIESSVSMFSAFGGDFSVRIPVDEVVRADTVVELRRDWVVVSGGGGVQVRDINPTSVRLSFERTRTASVPVYLVTDGSLPDGLALAQPLGLNPSVIRIRGPVGRVDALDSLALGPLNLGSVTESGTYTVPVETEDFPDLTFITTEAAIEVRLEEEVEQVVAGIPMEIDSLSEGVDEASITFDPRAVRVTLRGGRARVSGTRVEDLRAVVPGAALEGMSPGEVRVVPVSIRGMPDLVEAHPEVDSVQVEMRGADPELSLQEIEDAEDRGGPPPRGPTVLRPRDLAEGAGGAGAVR